MGQEKIRQKERVELVTSESYTSPCIIQTQSSQLINKYAEGYPGKRYYGGCGYVSTIEQLTIDRVEELFGADYTNVQPRSGSQVNFTIYTTLLQPGDTVLGMNLTQGGYLTHGSPVNFFDRLYSIIPHGIDGSGKVDYEDMAKQVKEYRPKMVISGLSAYSGIVDWTKVREVANSIGAYLFVGMARITDLIVVGVCPNPIPRTHAVTATIHKALAGSRSGLILMKGGDEELYKKLSSAVFPSARDSSLMHVVMTKAVALKEVMEPGFRVYQQRVAKNARVMAEVFLNRGYKVVSDDTENRLFLLDLVDKDLTGKEVDTALGRTNIAVNKNSVPNDPESPSVVFDIHAGSPAATRRSFKEAEIKELVGWMCDVLDSTNDGAVIERVKDKMLDIYARFSVYI